MAEKPTPTGFDAGRDGGKQARPWPRNKLVRVNPLPSKPIANARPDTETNDATMDERGAPSPVSVGDQANPPAGRGLD